MDTRVRATQRTIVVASRGGQQFIDNYGRVRSMLQCYCTGLRQGRRRSSSRALLLNDFRSSQDSPTVRCHAWLPCSVHSPIIVTGTFDQASLPIPSFLFFIPLMPGIAMGTTLRYLFSSSPHLHQACLFTSPASQIASQRPLSPFHEDKVAYKFIVGRRW